MGNFGQLVSKNEGSSQIAPSESVPDVLIVGAGIIGLASAYHIKRADPSAKVLIIDKAPAAAQGDTAKSAAGVRNMFSSEISRTLAETTITFYEDVQEKHGVDLGLRLIGYLWLMSKKQFQTFATMEDTMRQAGVQFKVWTAEELRQVIPALRLSIDPNESETQLMNLEDIAAGVQGTRCGIIAVERIAKFYEEEFLRLGGDAVYGLHVG